MNQYFLACTILSTTKESISNSCMWLTVLFAFCLLERPRYLLCFLLLFYIYANYFLVEINFDLSNYFVFIMNFLPQNCHCIFLLSKVYFAFLITQFRRLLQEYFAREIIFYQIRCKLYTDSFYIEINYVHKSVEVSAGIHPMLRCMMLSIYSNAFYYYTLTTTYR